MHMFLRMVHNCPTLFLLSPSVTEESPWAARIPWKSLLSVLPSLSNALFQYLFIPSSTVLIPSMKGKVISFRSWVIRLPSEWSIYKERYQHTCFMLILTLNLIQGVTVETKVLPSLSYLNFPPKRRDWVRKRNSSCHPATSVFPAQSHFFCVFLASPPEQMEPSWMVWQMHQW